MTEQSTGLVYRASVLDNNNTRVPNWTYRVALAYVTGSHSFKTGFNRVHGYQETTNYNLNALAFQFNNGTPNQLTMRANPVTFRNHLNNDRWLFAQERLVVGHARAHNPKGWGSNDDVRAFKRYFTDLKEAVRLAYLGGLCPDRAPNEARLPQYEHLLQYATFLPMNVDRMCLYWRNGWQ